MNPPASIIPFSVFRFAPLVAGLGIAALIPGQSARGQAPDAAAKPAPAGPAIFSGSQIQPEYPVPYRAPTVEGITEVMTRVRTYLETASPARLINRQTREEITDLSKPHPEASLDRGENNSFPLISYENGVTYAGMLLTGEVTGDARFTEFTTRRFQFIAEKLETNRPRTGQGKHINDPAAHGQFAFL